MNDTFIDIHNHCAWDIDDGMEDKEQAKRCLSQAQKDGISAIIATPHFVPGQQSQHDVQAMNMRIEELQELAKDYDIEVYPGSEVFLNSSYLDMIDDKNFNTLANSKYVLVEFDVRKDLSKRSEDVEDKLYEIKVRGYIPVIAHVERYFHKKVDMDRVKQWIQHGYIIQINRTSLLGMHGNTCKENAITLIEQGCTHVIASDAHRSSGGRICKMSDVYEYLVKKYDQDIADILCKENPRYIVSNKVLRTIPEQKKSIFQRLWKRS